MHGVLIVGWTKREQKENKKRLVGIIRKGSMGGIDWHSIVLLLEKLNGVRDRYRFFIADAERKQTECHGSSQEEGREY